MAHASRAVMRNPVRTTGMLVVNPGRSGLRSRRRRVRHYRSNVSQKRSLAAKKAWQTRKRKAAKRSLAAKKAARTRARRHKARSRIAVKTNRRHRRRNQGGWAGFVSGVGSIPLVGPFLAGILNFAPLAALGAISVEPTLWVASMLGGLVPQLPASWVYALMGLVTGGLILAFAPVAPAFALQLATATAAAAGGVAYYKWRTGLDTEMGSEMGLLTLNGIGALTLVPQSYRGLTVKPSYSDGFATRVEPFPGQSYGGHVVGV